MGASSLRQGWGPSWGMGSVIWGNGMRKTFVFPRAAVLGLALSMVAAGQQAPLKVVIVEGDGAINKLGDRSAKSPVVRVEDDDGRPIPGAAVTFVLPDMGAGAFFTDGGTAHTTATNDKGIATVHGIRPNNVAGKFQIRVTAAAHGQTATALINQINAAPAAMLRRGSSRKILYAALAAGGAVGAAIFAMRGGGDSSPAQPASSGTTITAGSPVFGPPR